MFPIWEGKCAQYVHSTPQTFLKEKTPNDFVAWGLEGLKLHESISSQTIPYPMCIIHHCKTKVHLAKAVENERNNCVRK